ncbi:hypothetical protein CERSUDRAFT_84791 [Gelatoporia subvermispora B]|uniref:Carboxypeptidase n=1 Tax=Ceriporiopsis subvermispora (strain B) TaxID=914234 RepID=M2PK22_CERS8|nr:hypothetical protein CERSUDRAFT_84791 [Gelatoporia subvermispora B]
MFLILLLCFCASSVVLAQGDAQQPFRSTPVANKRNWNSHSHEMRHMSYETETVSQHAVECDLFTHEAAPFSPLGNLNALSSTAYTILRHPLFPHYNVRIKQSHFCDGTTRAYTGYIDRETHHLFFYFFESRNDPESDDVIFWTNGGPGCSSATGLFMELGPCTVTGPFNATYNPYSWNNRANIFFVDQPIGVGFSYAEHGEFIDNTLDASKDIAAFVAIFFEHFTQFKGRPFHMAGESYGGRYIPVFAAEIYDQNARLQKAGLTPINLESIMIGNGVTNWPVMIASYYEMQCHNISVPPIQSPSTCVRMKYSLSRCESLFKKGCEDSFNYFDCLSASLFCLNELYTPMIATGYNPYDLSKLCEGGVEETLCYPQMTDVDDFLNRKDIRRALGVDAAVKTFQSCNDAIERAFAQRPDEMFPTQYYIGALLERGVRALIYVGDTDFMGNWVGNERMTLAVEWTGQDTFVKQPLREWHANGTPAGLTRSSGPFTFATIYGAGHLAPHDKPKESLELVNRWITQQDLQ